MDMLAFAHVLKKRFWGIACVIAIGCALAAVYGIYVVTPTYTATTKMIVNKSSIAAGGEVLDLNSINTSIMLVNTYKEIIKTSVVLQRIVAEYPELRTSQAELAEKINVSVIAGTQLITVTVSDPSYIRAMQIANAVSEVFKSEIPSIMKVDNVTILNKPQPNDNPSPAGANIAFIVVLAFLASGLVAVGGVLLLENLDDTLKTEHDVRESFGLPVLISVTNIKRRDMKRNETRGRPAKRGGEPYYAGASQ